ncbi:MAG: ATP-binding protein, partial [Myxococcota bacterium]
VRRSARIQLELPDLPILVRGDFVRLRRIVIELLSYTARTREESEPEPGDRGRIEVEVGAGRHSAFVRVRDNGVSTAEAQASPVLTDERAQTLGLSLAMRLTRALQGRLLVPSRSASPGTAAELVLPPAGDVLLHAVDSGFPVI